MPRAPFRVVQPYGRDRGREATVISTHPTIPQAFAAIDALSARMVQTGVESDYVELIVLDADYQLVPRPATH